eukprot:CAMPEP_0173149086 /NCGR_PEP_ID=MMETSP1105-20130129/10115_1 /TAXON_ID=2985 /ORGANISM="Ochromonas sp., Strain BG-1" /LENGTH=496 /DNA_ID=CAMNT_0014063883 /DNA_START=98 /DNA_END=1588 /DNA_ORIENTATION=+
MGNRSTGWNAGLSTHGIYALWFNLLFSASGFLCLCLCMGEMSSALPFSGGVFGFVRAALGPFFGFMVASCEFVLCIVGICLRALRFLSDGGAGADVGGVIGIFALCLLMNLMGGKPVFVLTSLIGFFTVMMLVVYLCGTLSAVGTDAVNYTHYSPPIVEFSWLHVMASRPAVSGAFNAIQFLPLLSEYMQEPREQLPRVLLISWASFLLMSVFVILAAVSQNPGAKSLQAAPLPLQAGFVRIFNIQDLRNIQWFDFPFQFGPIFCLFYCAGKQLLTLSKSGLLPPVFSQVIPGSETPYVCYTFTAIVGAGMNIFVLYNQDYLVEIRALNTTVSVTIFVFCFIAFVVFRRKFSSMSRSFVNPLGDFSAIYGSGVFIIAWIATLFYNPVNKLFLVGLGAYWLLCAIFFCTYLVHNQKFSEEEKKVMFKAYLINANRKKRLKRNNKVGTIVSSSSGVTDKPFHNLNTSEMEEIPQNLHLSDDDLIPSESQREEDPQGSN